MKAPIDIIAANLPTYADCYVAPREVKLPSLVRLTKDAARIMAALSEAGFEIVRKDSGEEGRYCPPGHVLLPQSKEEAEMMNIISERFLFPERFKTAAPERS